MPLTIDWDNQIINITSPTVTVAGQVLHDFIEDTMASPVGLLYGDIIQPEGKIEDPSNPGVYSQIIIILNSPWQIQFWGGSGYTRIYGAKLVGGLSDQPIKATGTAGDITVLESPVDGVTVVSGSGITEQDKDDIADKVWADPDAEALAYDGKVILDAVRGQAGTTSPIGTYGIPSNNLTDALTIAAARNIKKIITHSNFTIQASHDISGMAIETHGVMGTDIIFALGCSANNTVFKYANLSGEITLGDVMLVESCSIGSLKNFTGIMNVATFIQGAEISIGFWANFISCHAGGDPGNEPEISIGTGDLNINKYTGNLKLKDKTGTNRTVANFQSGNVIIDSTCVAGKIQILGIGAIERDDSGPNCQVDIDAAITIDNITNAIENAFEIVKDIDGGRWKIDKNLKQMIFYKADNITEVIRFDLFDADGSPSYENVFERRRVIPPTTTSTTSTTTTSTTTTSTTTTSTTTTSTTTTSTTAPPWVFRDTFTGTNGDDPNPTYWNSNTYLEIQSNQLYGYATTGQSGYVESKFGLSGDFDIYVLFDDLFTGATEGNSIALVVTSSDSTEMGVLSIRWHTGSAKFLGNIKHNDVFYGAVVVVRSNIYGVVRIIRDGTTLTLKYKDGTGDWTTLTSNIVDTDDFKVRLNIGCIIDPVYGDFDDFTINSGTMITTTTTTTTTTTSTTTTTV